MSANTQQATQTQAVPQAPTTMERWFPIATWLPKYDWGKYPAVFLTTLE